MTEWRWTDERGVQRLVGTDELRAALSSQVLPLTTLVWREGMKEWAPASSIPELAGAKAQTDARKGPAPRARPTPPPPRKEQKTLLGMPSPDADMSNVPPSMPIVVPSPGGPPEPGRAVITQIPKFGAPEAEGKARGPEIPKAPRLPAPSGLKDRLKPQRKLTTNDIDGLWASPASDDDYTQPMVRPAELQAARKAVAPPTEPKPAPAPEPAASPAPPPAAAPQATSAEPKPSPEPTLSKDDAVEKPATPPEPTAPAEASPAPAEVSSEKAGATPAAPEAAVAPAEPVPEKASAAPLLQPTAAEPPREKRHVTSPPPRVTETLKLPTWSKDMGERSPAPPKAAEPTPAKGAPHRPLPPPLRKSGALKGLPPIPSQKARPPVPVPAPSERPPPAPQAAAAESTQASMHLAELLREEDTFAGAAQRRPPIGFPVRKPTPQELAGATPAAAPLAASASPQRAPSATEPSPRPPQARPGPAAPSHAAAREPVALAAPALAALPPPPPREGSPPRPALSPQPPAVTPKPVDAEPVAALKTHPSTRPPQATPQAPPVAMGAPTGDLQAGSQASPDAHLDREPAPLPPAAPRFGAQPSPSYAAAQADSPASPVRAGSPVGGPGLRDDALAFAPQINQPVAVPVSSLLGAGGALIFMVIGAFFVGRCSAKEPPLVARPAFHAIPAMARAALPPPPKPCWVVRQPVMWASKASKSIPFDVVAVTPGALAVGYARDAGEAVGIEVTAASGEVHQRFNQKVKGDIDRVTPMSSAEFQVVTAQGGGTLASAVPVAVAKPFFIGVQGGAIATADRPDSAPTALWPISGSEAISAARVQVAGDRGYALTFRREGAIWSGWIGPDRKPAGAALTKVTGSGGSVGKPNSGWNRRELAVIFADKPEGNEHWEIRVGHAPTGQVPSTTTVIPLPKGGPGGDAFAPDIAGLPDGRWLMIWTEGPAGSRAIRAQTLAFDFTPLGDPIALSPPAGNFGQGVLGVVENYAGAVFLSKGSTSYELWGSILQCG